MAISTSDIDALPDWTVAQTLRAAKDARMRLLVGGVSRSMNGRTLTMSDLPDLNETIRRLEEAVASSASATGGLTAYAKFGDAQ